MATHMEDVYTAESIQVLEGFEAVRKRPGMYVGDVHDGSGLFHLLQELIDNCLNEHVAGHGDRIRVSLSPDGSISVEDQGRGIPVERAPGREASVVEVVMTTLFAGSRLRGSEEYALSAWHHWVGAVVVNALSEGLVVESRRDGWCWQQSFRQGVPLGPLVPVRPLTPGERTGTRVTFLPDASIFKNVIRLDPERVRRRLQDLSFLFRGLTLELHLPGGVEVFHEPDGLCSLVASRCGDRPVRLPFVAYFSFAGQTERGEPLWAEAALQWLEQGTGERLGFTGHHRLAGGTPFSGGSAGVLQGVHGAARWFGLLPGGKQWRDVAATVSERMVLVVRVDHPSPRYGSRTRCTMTNADIGALLRHGLGAQVRALLQDYPEVVRGLVAQLSGKAADGRGKSVV
jgi:DNA gyrase subunit B